MQKIRTKRADYVIALKNNQPIFCQAMDLYFKAFVDELPTIRTAETDHGHMKIRDYYIIDDISWLPEREDWTALKAFDMVRSKRIVDGIESIEWRYYIAFLTDVTQLSYAIRKHWAIENQQYWCRDAIFREDDSRARKNLSPLHLNVLRKTALALYKIADFGKRVSLKKTMLSRVFGSEGFLAHPFRRISFKCWRPAPPPSRQTRVFVLK